MFDDLGELRSLLASASPSTELFEQIASHIDFFQPPRDQELRHLEYVRAILNRWPSHIERPVPEMAFLAYSIQEIARDAVSPFLTLCNTLRIAHIPCGQEEDALGLCRHPHLSHIERVTLGEPYPSTDFIEGLVPALAPGIRHMDLSYTYATEFLSHLMASELFAKLDVLDLTHANLRESVFKQWNERAQQVSHGERSRAALRVLRIQGEDNLLRSDDVMTWIRSGELYGVEELDLRHHHLSDAFYEELARTSSLPALKWVHFSPYLVSPEARRLLASSRTLPAPLVRYWRSRCP